MEPALRLRSTWGYRAVHRPHRMPLRWFLPVLLGLTLWAWWCRWDQASAWRERPDEFTVDGRPLMGTADAYKWLRYADEIRRGTYRPGQADPLMAYPDGLPRPRPAPLLSVLLAHLSSAEDGALERTGLVLIPILAVMFIVPLGLLLWRAGYPAAGPAGRDRLRGVLQQ